MPRKYRKRGEIYTNREEFQRGSPQCRSLRTVREDSKTVRIQCGCTGGSCNYAICPKVTKVK